MPYIILSVVLVLIWKEKIHFFCISGEGDLKIINVIKASDMTYKLYFFFPRGNFVAQWVIHLLSNDEFWIEPIDGLSIFPRRENEQYGLAIFPAGEDEVYRNLSRPPVKEMKSWRSGGVGTFFQGAGAFPSRPGPFLQRPGPFLLGAGVFLKRPGVFPLGARAFIKRPGVFIMGMRAFSLRPGVFHGGAGTPDTAPSTGRLLSQATSNFSDSRLLASRNSASASRGFLTEAFRRCR
jgi:hypothetical protein